jgi:hypothetical protein
MFLNKEELAEKWLGNVFSFKNQSINEVWSPTVSDI